MVHYMTMTLVNIFEAKAQLSDLLERVSAGERILICKRNQPIAELRPVAPTRTTPRPVGGAKGLIVVSPAFFDPLPTEETDAFEGALAYPATQPHASRVADPPSVKPRSRRGRVMKRR